MKKTSTNVSQSRVRMVVAVQMVSTIIHVHVSPVTAVGIVRSTLTSVLHYLV